MNKNVWCKVLIILTIILMFVLLISNITFATIDTNINSITPNNEISELGNRITGAIKLIGIFVSVAMTMVIGIKYMVMSVEEKAEYKKTAIAYLTGAILIFATTQLIDFIYDIMN